MSALEPVTLTLIGFGSVNRTLAKMVARESETLASDYGIVVNYHAVVARHGSWEATDESTPLSAEVVGRLAEAVGGGKERLDTTPPPKGVVVTAKPSVDATRSIIARAPSTGLGCVVEAIDVDYEAGEPAATFLRDALGRRLHAISANKGPVVHHRAELLTLASANGVRYLHESAVMDGVPIFSAWAGGFRGAKLRGFRGCLNSTTTVVLTGMEDGQTYDEALKVAQDAGIAEADATGDLSGMDAAVKVVALAVALGLQSAVPLRLSDVDVGGIEEVTPAKIAEAKAAGHRLRLVGGASAGSPA
jgi:homoserine dehydrogenase